MLSFPAQDVSSQAQLRKRTFGASNAEGRAASEILPRLYLSDYYTATSRESIHRLGITHIMSVMEITPPPSLPSTVSEKSFATQEVGATSGANSDATSPVRNGTPRDDKDSPENENSSSSSPITNSSPVLLENNENTKPRRTNTTLHLHLQDLEALVPLSNRFHVRAADRTDENLLQWLDKTTLWIRNALQESPRHKILVHCFQGISRSATVVCAYIIATTGKNGPEAIEFVRSRRGIICPNLGFRHQLDRYYQRHKATSFALKQRPSPAKAISDTMMAVGLGMKGAVVKFGLNKKDKESKNNRKEKDSLPPVPSSTSEDSVSLDHPMNGGNTKFQRWSLTKKHSSTLSQSANSLSKELPSLPLPSSSSSEVVARNE